MQPTMKLRWKRVDGTAKSDPDIRNYYHESMVLQQWWEEFNCSQQISIPTGKGEWRDIEMQEPEIEEE